MSLGFLQTGRVQIVAAAENNSNARKTYKRNFKVGRVYTDVREIDYSELKTEVDHVDIVIGGPPCQGFSNANRQHTTIISMNNRLVKEYVRAVCELEPKAFVMENVAMLRSQIHRFMVDETDLDDDRIMSLPLQDEEVSILPANSTFGGALAFISNTDGTSPAVWDDHLYQDIKVLYRFRINQSKFDAYLEKYKKRLIPRLEKIVQAFHSIEAPSEVQKSEYAMAQAIIQYNKSRENFSSVILAIEKPLFMQRALLRMQELSENHIHVYSYEENDTGIIAKVKSYAVKDYIVAMLDNKYRLSESTLNALHYGAPQRRERFIIVGIRRDLGLKFEAPEAVFSEADYRTVRDAISDLEDKEPSTSVNAPYIEVAFRANPTELERELRSRFLYNHIVTETGDVAMSRFKALKAGQNFHDLTPDLKSTYSNADRTQNTIYMRLKYDEPSGTVVNVRKSMWIHPVLDRAISIREAARLQTFPDSFVFEGTKDSQYQQVGNAVPPFMAKAIAHNVISILDNSLTE